MTRRFMQLAAVILIAVSPMYAQVSTLTPPDVPTESWTPEPLTYGIASTTKIQIGGASLVQIDTAAERFEDGQGQFYVTPAGARLTATVNVPAGALLQGMDLYYDDTDAAGDLSATLFSMTGTTTNTLAVLGSAFSAGSTGKGVGSVNFAAHTVSNTDRQYMLYIFSTASNKKVRGISIRYSLQISPAPATATFLDVSNAHPFYQFIEAVAAAGITGGCGGGNYCPNDPITRGQMAAFLARALGLHFAP